MRKILFAILFIAPMMVFAQNWESVVPPTTKVGKTPLKIDESKKLTKAEKEQLKYETEKPYLAGAVPEIDGLVIYDLSLDMPGKSAQEIYDRAYQFLQNMSQQDDALEGTKIVLVDKEAKSIVAQGEEWLVFSKKILELDRTQFNYVIEANCTDSHLDFKISRLRYAYEVERKNGLRAHAEELITDRLMLAKDGRSLKKTNAKFRKKTVDRMHEIAENLRNAMRK